MDAYRVGDNFVAHFDLPGVDPGSIDLSVEGNTLTVSAERSVPQLENAEWTIAERPFGSYTRQLVLGRSLDTDRLEASYHDGVLTVSIPVAEKAKARKIQVTRADVPPPWRTRTIEGESSGAEGGRELIDRRRGAGSARTRPLGFPHQAGAGDERRPTGGDPLRRLDDPDFPALTMSQAAELLGVQAAFLRSLDSSRRPAAVPLPRRPPAVLPRTSSTSPPGMRGLLDDGHSLASAETIVGAAGRARLGPRRRRPAAVRRRPAALRPPALRPGRCTVNPRGV